MTLNADRSPSEEWSVIVFDFDGTLIDSNQLKYDAFYTVAENEGVPAEVVTEVLAGHREASRYDIVRLMLEAESGGAAGEDVQRLANDYGAIVVEAAKHCPEMPNAVKLLGQLKGRFPLFLSSTTPEEPLREIVAHRKWAHYFKAVYGYPRRKPDTLERICQKMQIDPSAALVVGDGESDREAASTWGAGFYHVDRPDALTELAFKLGL